jgi:small nuclear ribonucleoprotein (snRNP)-like protein
VVVINLFYKKKVISGIIIGFDEFMNLVVDDACEILLNSEQIKIGRILVRGDSILLIYENFSIKNN